MGTHTIHKMTVSLQVRLCFKTSGNADVVAFWLWPEHWNKPQGALGASDQRYGGWGTYNSATMKALGYKVQPGGFRLRQIIYGWRPLKAGLHPDTLKHA